MALTLQQVQKKAMARKAKEVQAKIEQAAQFGQPMLMGATDDVTGEEGRDPVGLADGGMVLGPEFDDRRALTPGFGLSGVQGGLMSRPESAFTAVAPGDLVAMAGKNTNTSVAGGGQPTALPALAPVQASPNITFGTTTAPLAPPAPITATPIPPPTAAAPAATPARRPRMAVTESPVIKANIKFADGGLVGNASGVLKNRAKQLEEQEAKALAPPKEEKPMPKPVEKKPEEKPRSFLETARKAVFGFKDGGRVGCADGGIISSIKSQVQTNPVYMAADALRDGVRAAAGNIPQGLAVTAAPILFGARALLGSKDAGAGSDLYPDPRTIPGAVDISAKGKGFSNGGLVRGPGTGTSDSVKAKGPNGEEIRLSDGEVVLPADTVQQLGVKNLENVIDQTHTPVKAKFGNGFADGLLLESPAEVARRLGVIELTPQEEIKRLSPPKPTMQARNPSYATGESPQARDFTRQGMRAEAKAAAERAVQNAKAAAPPPTAPPKAPLGKLASFGLSTAALGAGIGAATSLSDTDEQRARFNESMPLVRGPYAAAIPDWVGDVGRNAARVAGHVGNAITGGVAGRFGRGLGAAAPFALQGDTPDMGKAWDSFKGGFMTGPDDNSVIIGPTTANPNAPAVPSTKTPSGELMGPPSDLATPPDPLKTWQAQALAGMGAGPGSGYQARPDLGAPGEQWLRRGNSYVGVGNGPQKGNGIDFGFSRPSMQAAIAASGNSGYPEAPMYQENPAVSRLQSQIEQTAERLAQIKPGEVGGRALTNKLTALQGAMAALQAPSAAVNAFNEKRHGDEVSRFGAAQTALGTAGTNAVNLAKAKYEREVKLAEVKDARDTKQVAQTKYQREQGGKDIQSYFDGVYGAGSQEAKDMAAAVLAKGALQPVTALDGTVRHFTDLDSKSQASLLGNLEAQVRADKVMRKSGFPGANASGVHTAKPASFGASLGHVVRNPGDLYEATLGRGVTQYNDKFTATTTDAPTSLEAVRATIGMDPELQKYRRQPGAYEGGAEALLRRLTIRYGEAEARAALGLK